MTYYECKNCGATTPETLLEYFHPKSDYCMDVAVLKGRPICPECGSGELEQVNACDMCGEPCEDDKHCLCKACTKKARIMADSAREMFGFDIHVLTCLLGDYEDDLRAR